MTTVALYQPIVSVILHKLVGRQTIDGSTPVSERYAGVNPTIDLTPYLGDGGSVSTTKSVRGGAGGFSISLPDQPANQGGLDSLYALIEPMDGIEIRFSHGALSPTAPGKPPIIMWGFISAITRNQSMSQNGTPQRSVTITGQDYGKIWQQIQIYFFYYYATGQSLISAFPLYEIFGVGYSTTLQAPNFIQQVINQIIDPYLTSLMPTSTPMPSLILPDITAKHGTVSLSGTQTAEGSIYDILRQYLDIGAWNELFLDSREDGVYCVFRANPSRDLNGKLLLDDAVEPGTLDITAADIVSISVSRSDANVANFYWVQAERFNLVADISRKLYASSNGAVQTNYTNSQESLYGIRAMQVDTQMGGDDVTSFNSGQPQAEQSVRDSSMANWVDFRRELVVDQNKDNVLLESGQILLRGREDLKAGMTLRIHSGSLVATYYVIQVDHNFVPFGGFTTSATVERGTGFVERIRRGSAQSPYLQEQAPPQNVP